MGFIPDMTKVSMDRKYAARVFLDHVQTGNVSVFDRASFEYAEESHTPSPMGDTLVNNVIDVWGILDSAYCALLDMIDECRDCWQRLLVLETFLEVKEEYDMIEEWLAEGPEA